MIVTVGEVTQAPAATGRGVDVDIPVELLVEAGFARPSRQKVARVRVQILGFLDGTISASAVVHDQREEPSIEEYERGRRAG